MPCLHTSVTSELAPASKLLTTSLSCALSSHSNDVRPGPSSDVRLGPIIQTADHVLKLSSHSCDVRSGPSSDVRTGRSSDFRTGTSIQTSDHVLQLCRLLHTANTSTVAPASRLLTTSSSHNGDINPGPSRWTCCRSCCAVSLSPRGGLPASPWQPTSPSSMANRWTVWTLKSMNILLHFIRMYRIGIELKHKVR